MKLNTTLLKGFLFLSFVTFSFFGFSQTEQLSREELSIKKAEEKVENNRLKLVKIKRDIESADSLFVAGEELEKEAVVRKTEARDEIKAIEKKYKTDSKPAKKMQKSKDRSVSAEGRTELREITSAYKADLKAAQNKVKVAEKDIATAGRMMDKADKKLDMLKGKLKAAEKAYETAEKSMNEKKGIKK